MRRLLRLELSLELALASGAVVLFRVLRPAIDIGCGNSLTQASDDFIEFFSTHSSPIVVPALVALVELNYQVRPWVKRAVRLSIGVAAVVMLASYAILAASFIRR
ncbi:MAG: hypothetical protein U0228_29540 [Myxococcaceae bacterium]